MTDYPPGRIKGLAFYLEALAQFFYSEEAQGKISRQGIDLCGQPIALHFNNSRLHELIIPPLMHLTIAENQATNHDIFVVDQASMPLPIPEFPGRERPLERNSAAPISLDSETIFYQDNIWSVAYQPARNQLSLYKRDESQAVFWTASIDDLYPLDGRPFRTIFQWFLGGLGHQIVHAAGVGFERGGVIITGKGGAGKSSSAVACLNSDLGYAGDENVVVSIQEPLMVHSLYNSTNLDEKGISLMPFIQDSNVPIQEDRIEKSLFYLHEHFKHKLIKSYPLKAIVVSNVLGNGVSTLKPVSGARALTALAPTSIFQIPENHKAAFFRMSKIVKQVPCYQLNIGSALDDVPVLLSDLLQEKML